ncbi:Sip1-related alpha-galactosidase [Ructibacterium gallinarum]|uniref:Alpha-galactosidase n=1 Tax=Ructibacterium gallinarum TaxID=2779355 RepID=A0A9D5R7X0_9FIRM|nr:Sip1-related alpha-galactosidase [Ructibacterium gallinarum]MBE5039701.1 hypothetical protein [Ructibacterium gallinarum]
MKLSITAKLQNGSISCSNARLMEMEKEGLHAIYADAVLPAEKFPYGDFVYLDMDCAVQIEITEMGEITGLMADYRYLEYWCKPCFCTKPEEVPEETQALIYQRPNGVFGVIFPVVSEEYKCTLRGSKNALLAEVYSWYYGKNECRALAFVWGESKDPFTLMKRLAAYAAELMGKSTMLREERVYPEIFEYLGWCSWDAMQIRVSEQGLLEKCGEFKEKEIPVAWAIIDDMWAESKQVKQLQDKRGEEMFQGMHDSMLYSFQADTERFPNGLAHCSSEMKKFIPKIGIWHPTTGYWRGIDPEGEIAKNLSELLVKTGDGRLVHSWEYGKAFAYYDAFHEFLQDCGADFVKIDAQSFLKGFYKGREPIGKLARDQHKAIEESVRKHFKGQLINCMGMASENMWNRPYSAICRCSDDFQPENRAWFVQHLLQCSFNSLVQGQFLWCDWDMWWTDDSQAIKNSVLRAMSGGPVYISDKIGRTRKEVLLPLMYEDGRVIRCDRPAMPTADCLIADPMKSGKIFKLQNICRGSGILAAFHLSEGSSDVSGTISPSDVPGLSGNCFAVYEYFSRELHILEYQQCMEITLVGPDDIRLYNIVPLIDGNGVIGRIDKYISAGTVRYLESGGAAPEEEGPWAEVQDYQLKVWNENMSL